MHPALPNVEPLDGPGQGVVHDIPQLFAIDDGWQAPLQLRSPAGQPRVHFPVVHDAVPPVGAVHVVVHEPQ
jgi:hypothetical protein